VPVNPSSLATGGTDDPFYRHILKLFMQADDVAIVAAFVLETGLMELENLVSDALSRGARVRVLTGSYLQITQVGALRKLLGWGEEHPARFGARIVDMAERDKPGTTFHPKSWRFEGPDLAVAFVGSSNISRAALRSGVEWNLRVERARDPEAYAAVVHAYERLWAVAKPLTAAWIDAYEQRILSSPSAAAAEFAQVDAPIPHDIQTEALAALARTRADGLRRRALVVLATGLGKTWLAAFDAAAYAAEHVEGRVPRILFLAHREEILAQAERTFLALFYRARPKVGRFFGAHGALDADLVFASVQKLSRPEHLARLAAMRFDYAVVDEVHHGTAESWRAVLDRLDAGFVLGLTATPERADGADVLGLFDDHVAFRADIGAGIQRKLLVPFTYWGLEDEVDYTRIAWKNQRFDPAELARAVDTPGRLERMWVRWQEHKGRRTLVFCSTIEHAAHAQAFLAEKGVRALAVHSGPGSAERAVALAALERGEIEALCAVDIFNEGVDVPQIDTVVMLRPTESPVLFLQQLGRGLRVAPGKKRLTVIDFLGNHRIFLDRVRMLAALGPRPASVRDILGDKAAEALPPGCEVEIALEAKDQLLHLLGKKAGGKRAVDRAYAEITEARGIRPSLGELFRMGYPVKTVRAKEAGWFDFVHAKGGLGEAERRVLEASGAWLRHLESWTMQRCFTMVMIEALLEAGRLCEGLDVNHLFTRTYAIIRRSPELFRDLEGVPDLSDPRRPNEGAFSELMYADDNALDRWLRLPSGGKRPAGAPSGELPRPWFRLQGSIFLPGMPIPAGDEATFAAMTREIVDYRLAEYRERIRRETPVSELSVRRTLTAYRTLRAAAGAPGHPVEGEPEAFTVRLPTTAPGENLFAVRAAGDSMNGGSRPIHDGDWVILRRVPSDHWPGVAGHVALLAVPDEAFGESYLLKRVVAGSDALALRSDNPAYPPLEIPPHTRLIAKLAGQVHPEDLAPALGTVVTEETLPRAFGLKEAPVRGYAEGHRFVFVEGDGEGEDEGERLAAALQRVRAEGGEGRPGETAFVLVRVEVKEAKGWRYVGVARQEEGEGGWVLARGERG